MRPVRASTVAGGIASLRLAVGVAMLLAPKSLRRWQAPDDPSGPTLVLMTRTVGIRDIAVGVGTAVAARTEHAELRRWIAVGLVSDALDTLTGAVSFWRSGRRGDLAAALIPVPVVLADLWALSIGRGPLQPTLPTLGRCMPRLTPTTPTTTCSPDRAAGGS